MKKALVFLICIITVLSFSGCKDSDKSPAYDIDIAYFADMGKMPESEFKLGDSPSVSEEQSEEIYTFENGKESFLSSGEFNYYYDATVESPEIYTIIALSEGFGFEVGDISIEITDVLNEQGIKYTERTPSEDEIFFLPGSADRSIIECKSLKHKLVFVFESNALCALWLS